MPAPNKTTMSAWNVDYFATDKALRGRRFGVASQLNRLQSAINLIESAITEPAEEKLQTALTCLRGMENDTTLRTRLEALVGELDKESKNKRNTSVWAGFCEEMRDKLREILGGGKE